MISKLLKFSTYEQKQQADLWFPHKFTSSTKLILSELVFLLKLNIDTSIQSHHHELAKTQNPQKLTTTKLNDSTVYGNIGPTKGS